MQHQSNIMGIRFFLASVMFVCLMVGCDMLNTKNVDLPGLQLTEVPLTQYPSVGQVVAYYCPEVMGQTLCSSVVGGKPANTDMQFGFEPAFMVSNSNSFPIPMVEILLAVTVFPDEADSQALGAVCVNFCQEGKNCDAQALQGTCQSDETEIKSIDDFTTNAIDGLVGIVHDVTTGQDPNVSVRMIEANSNMRVNVPFQMGVDPMLNVIEHVALAAVDTYINGSGSGINIPAAFEGTIWFDIPYLGKIPLSFGPITIDWTL